MQENGNVEKNSRFTPGEVIKLFFLSGRFLFFDTKVPAPSSYWVGPFCTPIRETILIQPGQSFVVCPAIRETIL